MKRIVELTDKQQALIPIFVQHIGEKFTAKKCGEWYGASIAGITLSSLTKYNILHLVAKNPNVYIFTATEWLEWNYKQNEICKNFTQEELEQEETLSYLDLCDYLIKKYSCVDNDFFKDDSYKNPNANIKRSKDGLFVHHIDENKFIMLSNPDYIKLQNVPFDCQKASHLVYCNWIEHILLHWKIYEEYNNRTDKPVITIDGITAPIELGIGGIFNYMIPQINDYYKLHTKKEHYIKWDKELYINFLHDISVAFNRDDVYEISFEDMMLNKILSLLNNKECNNDIKNEVV